MSQPDPSRALRLRTAVTAIVGTLALVAAASWAMRPLPPIDPTASSITPGDSALDAPLDKRPVVDPAVFSRTVWHTPPPAAPKVPKVTKPVAVAPKTVSLQLIAISGEPGALRASLFDNKSGRLHEAAEGARVAGYTVERITFDEITLRKGAQSLTLRIRREEDGS